MDGLCGHKLCVLFVGIMCFTVKSGFELKDVFMKRSRRLEVFKVRGKQTGLAIRCIHRLRLDECHIYL